MKCRVGLPELRSSFLSGITFKADDLMERLCGLCGFNRGFETVLVRLGQEKGRQKEGKCRRGGVLKGA